MDFLYILHAGKETLKIVVSITFKSDIIKEIYETRKIKPFSYFECIHVAIFFILLRSGDWKLCQLLSYLSNYFGNIQSKNIEIIGDGK